ncbi:LuxR family transcriptional regulator, maltose regulon positive regulatory protein [Duganella sp. CF402]|uniref:LuxR C-terminal-related transcriptional regulator n=1 Tax=unclassified Duganella TaxID=2636909 RepID=UPI0008BC30C6|nr:MULTISPECIES: LuxR C-terminal-related transcriptional regulator [unclassified Duganella]RZT10730.1 LuxR family maltose regulon positive regulatory protein [Duganella sp. BK701]SEK99704.1 LuxR family transcriptional regulator, maltose regulon positive regulatory protein [Duganella sp. CF402]
MLDFVAQKLIPPQTAGTLMARPDVLARLGQAGGHRIILLRAPAGYGKTSVLRLLRAGLSTADAPVAWLTFDQADRDPARLLLSLRAALLGDAAEAHMPRLHGTAVRHLFLDDVEQLDEGAIRLLLSVIVEVLPPDLRVYLAGRGLHQVSVASLKAKQMLLELNLESLRFVPAETEIYLRQSHLFLSDEHVRWLHQATEGWPAALELLVLAWKRIQGNAESLPDLHGTEDLSDYLAEEVLRAQPEEVQAFLIATAPLQSFCVELADAVRGSDDSRELIVRTRLSGLPIQPIGEHWFRYHPLFAGHIVRHRLPAGAGRALVYARAGQWLAANDRGLDAFDCYIKAGQHEAAADVLEALGETLLVRAQFPSITHCCGQLPEALLRRRPEILRVLLVALTYSPRHEDGAHWLEYFRAQAAQPDADRVYGDVLRGFEPVQAFLEGDVTRAIGLTERYWPAQQQARPVERGMLATSSACAYLIRGMLPQAVQMLIEARRTCAESGSLTTMAVVVYLQAYMDAMQGRFDAALQQIALIDEIQKKHSSAIPAAFLYRYSAGLFLMVLYETNRIDDAQLRVKFARGIAGIGLPWDTVAGVQVTQARLMALQMGPAAAKRWLECEIMRVRKQPTPRLRAALESELSRLVVLGGNRAAIAGYAALLNADPAEAVGVDGNGPLPEWMFSSQEIDGGGIAQARLAIADGRTQAAQVRLQRLLRQAEESGRRWRAVKLRVLLALAAARGGDPLEALARMALALEQGAQCGMVRSFLDEGEGVVGLLEQLRSAPPAPLSSAASAHLNILLACGARAGDAARPPVAELTPAEASLLELVAQGLSNREVADSLGLSINTVKWHMAQIFSKFGVANRVQAVNLARQGGMLGRSR